MKTLRQRIEGIDHEMLVDLFATATYGNYRLDCDIPSETRERLDFSGCKCIEDKWAKTLLSGCEIGIIDLAAEGEIYNDHGNAVVSEDGDESVCYLITLDDIKKGLLSALDGTFKGADDSSARWLRECVENLLDEDDCNDLPEADALIQVIAFGELIYG